MVAHTTYKAKHNNIEGEAMLVVIVKISPPNDRSMVDDHLIVIKSK